MHQACKYNLVRRRVEIRIIEYNSGSFPTKLKDSL
jgi:hypothetical protein